MLGGIATVFNAELEFREILKDCELEDKKGFSLFCERDKTIISSTNSNLKPLDKVNLDDKYFSIKETIQDFVKYDNKDYFLTVALSKGYREYKTTDNYKNDVLAFYFIEV